jgi:hypothetical protein
MGEIDDPGEKIDEEVETDENKKIDDFDEDMHDEPSMLAKSIKVEKVETSNLDRGKHQISYRHTVFDSIYLIEEKEDEDSEQADDDVKEIQEDELPPDLKMYELDSGGDAA